jgi:hypothetical protein
MKTAIAAAVLMALTSCATAWLPRQEARFWDKVAQKGFAIRSLVVSTRPTTGDLQKTAMDLAVMAAHGAGVPLDDGAAQSLTISLDEREFGVDIDTFNSVSAVIKIWVGDRQVGQIVCSEDTKRTLRAASYLEQVLDMAFGQLAQELRK